MTTAFDPAFRLDGRKALVSGAVAGLGFEIAQGLARAGAKVGLHGRDADRVSEACQRVTGATPVVFDLTDAVAMEREVDAFVMREGGLDVLICNAGLRDRRTFLDTTIDTLRDLLETNLTANFALVQRVAPHMIKAGRGSIVFITTNAAIRGPRRGSTYAASKGGLDALTRSLAVELGPQGIRVNAISPGYFATEFNAGLVADAAVNAGIDARVPLKRWAQPNEIVGPALFLASDAASYVNGQTLVVDGGMAIMG